MPSLRSTQPRCLPAVLAARSIVFPAVRTELAHSDLARHLGPDKAGDYPSQARGQRVATSLDPVFAGALP